MDSQWNRIKRIVALAGGILGLAAGSLVGAARLGWIALQHSPTDEVPPPSGDGALGGLAFALVFLLPFALCLFALRREHPASQAAIWLGSAVLAAFGSVATFSALTLVTMPLPAVLLGAAGLMALRQAGMRQVLPVLGVAVVLVIVGGAAFFTLFWRDDPACWALIRTEAGEDVWEPRPYSQSSPRLAAEPGPEDVVSWSCSTDVISTRESLMSLGLWAVALLALAGLWPRWERASSPER